jgi:hypothetical protein
MTRTRSWQLTCLAQGDAAPLVPTSLSRLRDAVWSARTLDAFLTELDAGGDLPDALLAFGGEELIRALRSHDRTCALPVFLFAAAEQAAPPGWDSTWSGEDAALLEHLAERADRNSQLPPLVAPLDSLRREHRFARWLAGRGHCQLTDPEVFGLDAPRSTLSRWQACGWVTPPARTGEAWKSTPALRAAASRAVLVMPAPSPELATPSRADFSESQAEARPLPRGVLLTLSAFLVVLAALVWNGSLNPLRRPGADPEALAQQRSLRIGDGVLPARGSSQLPFQPAPASAGAQDAIARDALALSDGTTVPRVVTRGTVRRETSAVRALSAGRVAALLAAPGSWQERGSPLARLIDPRAEADVTRLEQELREVDAAIEAGNREDAQARSLAWTQSELERERLSGEISRTAERSASAQDLYTRALRLAEEGVIAFREVRPDWDALQQAREDEERARAALDDFLTARAQPADGAKGSAPAWLLTRRTRLEDELRTARSMAAPRLVRAEEPGEWISWTVAVGIEVEEAGELGKMASGPAWIEAKLESAERGSAGKIAAVELRLGADGDWIAAEEYHEILAPDAGALLRARVPQELQSAARTGAAGELRFRYLD